MMRIVRERVAAANAAIAARRGFACVKRPLPYATVDEYVRAWNLAALRKAIKEYAKK